LLIVSKVYSDKKIISSKIKTRGVLSTPYIVISPKTSNPL